MFANREACLNVSAFFFSLLLTNLTSHLQRHGMTSTPLMNLLILERNQAETSTLEQIMVRFISQICYKTYR